MPLHSIHHNHLCLVALALLGTACGSTSLSTAPKLTIGMLGVFTAPTTATGNNMPKSETFSMLSATATTAAGKSLALYEGKALSFTVVNRPQIILEYKLSEVSGETISSVSVLFDSSLTATGKYNSAMTTTLTNATVTYAAPLVVTTTKAFRLNVNVDWENTVNRDDTAKTESLQSPTLELVLGDSGS